MGLATAAARDRLGVDESPKPGALDSIGSVLASRRRRLGLTQADVARIVARRQSLISRWENGARAMTLTDFASMCGALRLVPDEVLSSSFVPGDVRQRSSRVDSRPLRIAIGSRLAAARVRCGLSAIQVWRATGLTPYRLGVIEDGRDATLSELQRLLPCLGVRVADILGKEPLTGPGFRRQVMAKAIRRHADPATNAGPSGEKSP